MSTLLPPKLPLMPNTLALPQPPVPNVYNNHVLLLLLRLHYAEGSSIYPLVNWDPFSLEVSERVLIINKFSSYMFKFKLMDLLYALK